MKRLRAAIADRHDAERLNREWDAYVRSVGRASGAGLRPGADVPMLHLLDAAPEPDSAFLSATWQRLQAQSAGAGAPLAVDPESRDAGWLRLLRKHGRNRPSPSLRLAVAAFGVLVIALSFVSGQLLPARGEVPLVASALASAQPTVASTPHRVATSQPFTVVPTRSATILAPTQTATPSP